jgi:hypothetical protein
MRTLSTTLVFVPIIACAGPGGPNDGGEDGLNSGLTSNAEESGGIDDEDAGDGAPIFDVAPNDEGGSTGGEMPGSCKIVGDMDATPPCDDEAPADSFDPQVQWSWAGEGTLTQVFALPAVANFTDDNDDGEIDLCDVPDIAVIAFDDYIETRGALYLLDGETGEVHWKSPHTVAGTYSPAVGDIDGDGLVEVVVADWGFRTLSAYEHDGSLKWKSAVAGAFDHGALALADLDNDKTVEIISGEYVYAHDGTLEVLLDTIVSSGNFGHASTAADLDGDGDLEVIAGPAAFHHDGAVHFNSYGQNGYPQVADLDGDGEPEILVQHTGGISTYEADGTPILDGVRPSGVPAGTNKWRRPVTIHDFDGDGEPEVASSSYDRFTVIETDATVLWSAEVLDKTGSAGSTAFDFLGAGKAQAMYADEKTWFTYDDQGQVLLSVPRSSGTVNEYPVVSDVDNDGSAEVVVVSNEGWFKDQTTPAVQVVRDAEDRWVPARRIWNQHTYHVTNVREDGTIPQFELPHWEHLNTFRTQAQIGGDGVCKPEPEG